MKRTIFLISFLLTVIGASAQTTWWVFLADKAGTTFDPYSYFDAKAIERYAECGANLYDVSNYPLNDSYVNGVAALATEEVGCSRWMNAVGIVATPEQAAAIEQLPYVLRVQPIESNMQLASENTSFLNPQSTTLVDTTLADQLLRMQGQLFREKGIDGTGIRIAVFDGGFPKVNTHEAFRHLRESGRILKTWNFPNRKEDVYGWNGHGTMTLSCIAGRMDGKDLGLATGAEFLLARTEVEPEPFKEEIWWQQAVEWADKNGANIISSSLGYGKDRYYTKDMDGKSYVAKAANMAARKGMLVVNSAGNEGDDKHWQYIITPSDADSVLCIGGITHSLTDYEHIDFASYGPSADGRQKPNLCAFGHAWAANPHGKGGYQMVYGTSFSCPLVAGFAACAWQASKGKTNMEMFDLLQRSGDLYPYCDYAFGYGVPQASFFVGDKKEAPAAKFRFETQTPTSVSVIFTQPDSNVHVFYKDVDANGRILTYGKRTLANVDTTVSIDFHGGNHLVVFTGGYMADYRFENASEVADKESWTSLHSTEPGRSVVSYDDLARAPRFDIAKEKRFDWDVYFLFGHPIALGDELTSPFFSPAWRVGVRGMYKFSKAYSVGLALEYGEVYHNYRHKSPANALEQLMPTINTALNAASYLYKRHLLEYSYTLEIFQRVRFVPGGTFHKGLHWDLGVYGAFAGATYVLGYALPNDSEAALRDLTFYRPTAVNSGLFIYGVTTRVTYDWIGIYGRYRLDGIGQAVPAGQVALPRLEVGLQILL
ncbi:MAG: S8 family serine peptidase [Bacteroidales bacterium]|nr:S8 family serine peptidase [Bacteroidales bacterium]